MVNDETCWLITSEPSSLVATRSRVICETVSSFIEMTCPGMIWVIAFPLVSVYDRGSPVLKV